MSVLLNNASLSGINYWKIHVPFPFRKAFHTKTCQIWKLNITAENCWNCINCCHQFDVYLVKLRFWYAEENKVISVIKAWYFYGFGITWKQTLHKGIKLLQAFASCDLQPDNSSFDKYPFNSWNLMPHYFKVGLVFEDNLFITPHRR